MAYFKELGEKLKQHHDNMEEELKKQHSTMEEDIKELQSTVADMAEILDNMENSSVTEYTEEEISTAVDEIWE